MKEEEEGLIFIEMWTWEKEYFTKSQIKEKAEQGEKLLKYIITYF